MQLYTTHHNYEQHTPRWTMHYTSQPRTTHITTQYMSKPWTKQLYTTHATTMNNTHHNKPCTTHHNHEQHTSHHYIYCNHILHMSQLNMHINMSKSHPTCHINVMKCADLCNENRILKYPFVSSGVSLFVNPFGVSLSPSILSQIKPLEVTSGLNTTSNQSLSYSARKSFNTNHSISTAQ